MEPIDTVPVIEVIGSVVFTASSNLQAAAGGVALQSPDVTDSVSSGQNGVFAGSFLAPAPSGVSEYVHIWAPVG